MKKIKTLLLTSLVISLFSLSSCKKDVQGCTDVNATNHNTLATVDNGTCAYQGKVVPYLTKASSDLLLSVGVASIQIYIDGTLYTSAAANTYYTSAPTCSTPGVSVFTYNMGNNKQITSELKIITNTGDVGKQNITIYANQCTPIAL